MGIGDGASLKVDPELLAQLGNQLQTAAAGLPEAPEPFVVSGTDPISLAIAGRLPDVEGGIQEALPKVKADATTTATNVIAAAGKYKGTDEQLAAQYEKHQFDQAGSSSTGTSGSAGGGGGAMGQMSQMMSMPMQMASQAAQMPMQAMSAVASAPQAVMQGVQQIGQMTGGLGKAEGGSPSVPADTVEAREAEPKDADAKDAEAKDAEPKKQDQQSAAAPGAPHAERAPASVPQQSSPRHAAPDPQVNL